MYHQDVINFCRCIDPGPSGFKLAAYLHASIDLGPRAISWLHTHPSKRVRRGQSWWVEYPPSKQVNNRNLEAAKLSDQHTAPWIERWMESRDMAEFENANNLFAFGSIEDIDRQMDRVGRRAGYPQFQYSSGSLHKGFSDTVVCNLILSGRSLAEALDECKAQGGWSCVSNVVRFYVSQLVNYCQYIVTQPNPPASVDDLDMLVLHPEFERIPNLLINGNLPQPTRPLRFCDNDGEPPAVQNACQQIWHAVQNPNDQANFAQINVYALRAKLDTLASRFFNHFQGQIPASWHQAVQDLCLLPNGNLATAYKARGKLINVLI